MRHFFVFFAQAAENAGFPQNLACAHGISSCTCQIFVRNFLTFRNVFPMAGAYAPRSQSEFPIYMYVEAPRVINRGVQSLVEPVATRISSAVLCWLRELARTIGMILGRTCMWKI